MLRLSRHGQAGACPLASICRITSAVTIGIGVAFVFLCRDKSSADKIVVAYQRHVEVLPALMFNGEPGDILRRNFLMPIFHFPRHAAYGSERRLITRHLADTRKFR